MPSLIPTITPPFPQIKRNSGVDGKKDKPSKKKEIKRTLIFLWDSLTEGTRNYFYRSLVPSAIVFPIFYILSNLLVSKF